MAATHRGRIVKLTLTLALGLGGPAACGRSDSTGPNGGSLTVNDVDVGLSIGESQVIVATEEAIRLRFSEMAGSHEYQIVVHSASQVDGATTTLQMRGSLGSAAVAAPPVATADNVAPAPAVRSSARTADLQGTGLQQSSTGELAVRRSARAALQRSGAAPANGARAGGLFGLASVPPQQGDTLRFALAVQPDLTVSCTDTATVITAVVRRAGLHITVVEDIQTASSAFGQAEYDDLVSSFDNIVFPTDTAYFGAPADIDGNSRVIALFTPEVNKLTPRNSDTFIGGFFIPSDLADSGPGSGGGGTAVNGICQTSNEAEILYLLAPDPNGQFSDRVSTVAAIQIAKGVTAHELHHLLSAEQRVFFHGGDFFDLEDIWLAEGLSHAAEEVVGLKSAGLAPRQNIDFNTAITDITSFNSYQISNFGRVRQYFVNPNSTQAIAETDPGGFESLEMRGFAWLFVRWLGDQASVNTSGGLLGGAEEESVFRQLASGGPQRLRGIANVERAASLSGFSDPEWAELLGQYTAMPAVDDAGVAGIDPANLLATWNLTDVYFGLSRNPGSAPAFPELYPLALDRRQFTNFTTNFDVGASTAKYFVLAGAAATPAFTVDLLGNSGRAIPSSARIQVTVLRTQ